jgi:hypothetical protein
MGVANAPGERATDVTCGHAVGELEFLHQGVSTMKVRARWADNDYAAARAPGQSADDLRRRDLHPNGEVHYIQVALMDEATHELFAASHDYWASPATREQSRLDENEYQVTVVISGTRAKTATARYLLRIVQGDPPFELKLLTDDPVGEKKPDTG